MFFPVKAVPVDYCEGTVYNKISEMRVIPFLCCQVKTFDSRGLFRYSLGCGDA